MSLEFLLLVLRRRIVALSIVAATGGAIGFGASTWITPQYIATAQVVALVSDSTFGSGGYEPVDFSKNRIPEYASIVETASFLERVRSVHGLRISSQQLRAELSISSPAGSSIMVLAVRSTSPVQAADDVNATATELAAVIPEREALLPVRATVIERALPPGQPVTPFTRRIVVLSAWTGFAVGLIFAVTAEAIGRSAGPSTVTRRWARRGMRI